MASGTKLLEFMSLVGHLKRTVRAGWRLRNVNHPESVAEHMYRMAVLSFLVDEKDGLNRDRCIKIALVHDMAESIVGDLTPSCGVSKEEKCKREFEAMQHISSLVSQELGQELLNLFEEYELQKTEEAKFVKDLDRFEMVLQAYEYEKEQKRPGELQDFFESTKGMFQHPKVKSWILDLYEKRKTLLNGKESDKS